MSETLQLLLFTAVGFFLLIKKLAPEPTISLDTDWFYRMGGRAFLWLAKHPVQWIDNGVGALYRGLGLFPLMLCSRVASLFDNRIIDGFVDGLALTVRNIGSRLRIAQRGAVQENLALVFVVSVILIMTLFFAY